MPPRCLDAEARTSFVRERQQFHDASLGWGEKRQAMVPSAP